MIKKTLVFFKWMQKRSLWKCLAAKKSSRVCFPNMGSATHLLKMYWIFSPRLFKKQVWNSMFFMTLEMLKYIRILFYQFFEYLLRMTWQMRLVQLCRTKKRNPINSWQYLNLTSSARLEVKLFAKNIAQNQPNGHGVNLLSDTRK